MAKKDETNINNGSAERKPLLNNGDKESTEVDSFKFDGSEDIQIALVLGNLIYALDQMRKIADVHNFKYKASEGESETDVKRRDKFLSGNLSFITSDGNCTVDTSKHVPANPVKPNDILSIIKSHPSFFNEVIEDAFVNKNINLLDKMSKIRNLFLNNFSAVHNDTEVVYGITAIQGVAPTPSQISVVFRGSVYFSDWNQNIKASSRVEVKIKIEEKKAYLEFEGTTYDRRIRIKSVDLAEKLKEATKGTRILVHRGFFQYLFETTKTSLPKYNSIVKDLSNLMKHRLFNRNSELTVTGHSLGGALATLLSFFVACDTNVIKKLESKSLNRNFVSCISFAAPVVGNAGFQKAFRLLEDEGLLKHLRITNKCDFVPLAPPLPWYHHTGVQVDLRGEDRSLGCQQDIVLRDTSVTSFGNLSFQFCGCMLTTFPLLIPLLPPIGCLGLLFIKGKAAVITLLQWDRKDKPVETGKSPPPGRLRKSLKEEPKTEIAKSSVVRNRKAAFILGTVIPVCFAGIMFYDVLSHTSFVNLPTFGQLYDQQRVSFVRLPPLPTFGDATEFWLNIFFNRYLVYLQFIMLARQPYHILGVWCDYGHTHSLKFYNHNLFERKKSAAPPMKSSALLWNKVRKDSCEKQE